MIASLDNVGSIWAREKAVSAVDALVGVEHDLWFRVDSLWVLAPETVKRATLQKDGCADAWSVVDREPLDVEDNTLVSFGVQVFSGTINDAEKINLHITIGSERKTVKPDNAVLAGQFLE
jgi:hypothetical protein